MFISILFIRAPDWKQPKCPSTSKWKSCCILFSNKHERSSDIHYNMNETQGHYFELKKLDKIVILYYFIYMNFKNRHN